MLTRLRIERFKRFGRLDLSVRPLTVLTGANGAGKTSVFHALLLCQQAARHPERPEILLNGYQGLKLGSSLDVLHTGASPTVDVALLTADGREHGFSFFADDESPRLHLTRIRAPEQPWAVLTRWGRAFTYLCAERLGPRAVLPVDSAGEDALDIGHDGRFVAHVLNVLGRRSLS